MLRALLWILGGAIAIPAALLDPWIGFIFALPFERLILHHRGRWATPRRRRRGLALVLTGIEGPSVAFEWIAAGLHRAGWRGAIALFPWNDGLPLWRCGVNLMNAERQQLWAERLCQTLNSEAQSGRCSPIHVIAVSGGTGIVARALQLPTWPPSLVHHVIWLAPSVSPGIPLPDLNRSGKTHLTIFESCFDLVMLGFFTTLLGTSDRRFRPALGLCGRPTKSAAITELRWRPAWIHFGHLGGHCTCVTPAFVRNAVAPVLRAGDNHGPCDLPSPQRP